MTYYRYERNEKEVTLWLASGSTGWSLEDCLKELDELGISYNIEDIPAEENPTHLSQNESI
jgi:hypothetical protein